MKLSVKVLNTLKIKLVFSSGSQELASPPRPHDDTWRTGGVMIGFFHSNLIETFCIGSLNNSELIVINYNITI